MSEVNEQIFSVSEITKSIKFILESSFEKISIEGEISNFKAHSSGHWYFSLKDEGAVINCTMWKGVNNFVFFTPEDGMKVIVTGRLTVYAPRGSYQIDVRTMKPAGVGELQAAFERLKKKLYEEGLFDEQHKKPIPYFPKKIALITSSEGAAVRDMISVAERRYPLVELLIVPTKVQGSDAAKEIVKNLDKINLLQDIDIVILARGGGSIEDLWPFNEEIVARAIFNSKIPVITGIGHEVDFTIADFVSDLRAPTPSVAMELATPDQEELKNFVTENSSTISELIDNLINEYKSEIEDYLNSYTFKYPLENVRRFSQQLDTINLRVNNLVEKKVLSYNSKLSLISKTLEGYDLQKSLKKGFALIKQNSKFVTRKNNFNKSEPHTIQFYDGEVKI
ncbi:MAG TPA: exodeoxyribonuclease VII large subunit [Ignavibacteriaceae bacterium]|jgi:exodeoxyribonuclease VII large subunit|nr:MAG: Exodeoxyribonuclease 7 large subunit [Ignavibacteria bacterium ADurb.Bin266]OQY72881.1 MAG: exodeoxyribonuclease VII large subunit [Ignavibacteriales bacterium UTCHB2]HQF42026.1 exodeoxyribonuclease VII large subunit [Ignavibacteriaceae bacterium]HQI42158.1 exodeoxyribonuclease VII large subunit [Ignavibacteriaceae bacterium]HQJ46136.1 exodeoxyribonuclease VII large subunit [Ignavibacteriaceae bacterium]